jgi:hypothetical protein
MGESEERAYAKEALKLLKSEGDAVKGHLVLHDAPRIFNARVSFASKGGGRLAKTDQLLLESEDYVFVAASQGRTWQAITIKDVESVEYGAALLIETLSAHQSSVHQSRKGSVPAPGPDKTGGAASRGPAGGAAGSLDASDARSAVLRASIVAAGSRWELYFISPSACERFIVASRFAAKLPTRRLDLLWQRAACLELDPSLKASDEFSSVVMPSGARRGLLEYLHALQSTPPPELIVPSRAGCGSAAAVAEARAGVGCVGAASAIGTTESAHIAMVHARRAGVVRQGSVQGTTGAPRPPTRSPSLFNRILS